MAVQIFDLYNALGLTAENGTQTLVNAIRNSAGLSEITQVWDGSVTGLQNFGAAVNSLPRHQNSFLNELIDRIGLVVIEQADLRNPLKSFKRGTMEFGRSVQEIFTDLVKAQSFNPEDAETTLFKRNPPNTKVLFHDNWRKEMYPTTIEEEELQHAFVSVERFESFIVTIYNALYNSNEYDEYVWMRALLESYINNGFASYVAVSAPIDQVTSQAFVKAARATSKKLTLPQGSRLYNNSGVMTRTPEERLWIIIDADLEASIDVDVLAYAFNMDKASLKDRTIIIEGFATTGLQAVLIDQNIFQIYDKEFKIRTIENPKGLYWNVYLHVHQLFSMSRFCNIVAFMSAGIPLVQRLTLSPLATYMTAGSTMVFNGQIISASSSTTITAAVTDATGATVTGATAVVATTSGDSSGGTYSVTVTIPSSALPNSQMNLVVTATNSTFSTSQTSIIQVLPVLTT